MHDAAGSSCSRVTSSGVENDNESCDFSSIYLIPSSFTILYKREKVQDIRDGRLGVS